MNEGRLRVATLADAAAIAAIYAPYVEATAISFETEPPDVTTMAQRIAKVLSLHPWLVATVADRDGNDQVVGYAYASPHRDRAAYRWSVDVAAYLDARFHRRGIAKHLYEALCAILKMQNIVNAFGLISLPNTASAALHESCGFVRCATEARVGYKFDAWHDVGMWQKVLQTGAAAPVEPVPFMSLPADAVARVLGG